MAYLGKPYKQIEEEKRLRHLYGLKMSRSNIRKEKVIGLNYDTIAENMAGYPQYERMTKKGYVKIYWRTEDVAKVFAELRKEVYEQ